MDPVVQITSYQLATALLPIVAVQPAHYAHRHAKRTANRVSAEHTRNDSLSHMNCRHHRIGTS
jgi:hypothetical protein